MGSTAKVEFLDDYDTMLDEVLEFDEQPEIRIQGRGRGLQQGHEGPRKVEASIIVTHLDSRKNIIRESIIYVGEVDGDNEEEVEALKQRMLTHIEEVRERVKDRGCIVKNGRWVS
jgi:di/tripeptidase